jgi:hypothetical protein
MAGLVPAILRSGAPICMGRRWRIELPGKTPLPCIHVIAHPA